MGFDDKTEITKAVADYLKRKKFETKVFRVDKWPDIARKVAEEVARGRADQGILLCWTGTGTSIAANKVKGVRAALVWDPWIAEGTRRWNDANVLVMSSKRLEPAIVSKILDAWFRIKSPDLNEAENITKLKELDEGY